MNPECNRGTTTRPRRQQLKTTAQAGLCTENTTPNTSSTRRPRTRGSPARQVQNGPTVAKPTNNETKRDNYTSEIRLCKRSLQGNGTNSEQGDCEVTNTTVHQRNLCGTIDWTVNRPHASRPTPDERRMQGLKQERRLMGWQHHGGPRLPTPAHKHNRTPQIRHYATDQPTSTTYTEPPAPRESASLTQSAGLSTRHGMRVP